MPDGYTRGENPDDTWWLAQIKAGDDYRKKAAYQDKWDRWRKYYRGEWADGVLPVQMFFSHLRSMVPRVYFRNPAVSIVPNRPGFLEMAFAQVTHRLDNKLIHTMGLKDEAKMMVHEAFLFGTAAGKLGFGGRFTPSPPLVGREGDIPQDKGGRRVEYDPRTSSNTPWFARVPTGNLIVPDGLRDWRHSRWVAECIWRPIDDVKNDPRFNSNRTHVQHTKIEGTHHQSDVHKPVQMVQLYEVRDAKTRRVMVLAPDSPEGKRVLLNTHDVFQLTDLGFNIFPLIFNPDEERFWGVPDSQILEPYQLERNEGRTLLMKHRRLSLVKLLVEAGKIDDDQISNMLSEDVAAVVKINGSIAGAVEKLQPGNIPTDLIVADREVEQDSRQALGFSRNQLGELQSRRGDTSATEAAIVQEAAEIRVDERRDAVADMIVRIVEMMNEVVFNRWTGREVMDVVGPGGAQVWVRFDPADLKMGHYAVKVDPDTSTPRTRGQREAKAVRIYEILRSNPLVDPLALTRFLLTEVEGVEMDDLMRVLPSPEGTGGTPSNPLSLPAFAQLLQGSVASAQSGQAPIPAVLR